jgi:phage shock protein C
MNPRAPLRRSVHDRQIAGVCAGLADYFEVDSTLARVVFVVASVLLGGLGGIVLYIILWIIIPERGY